MSDTVQVKLLVSRATNAGAQSFGSVIDVSLEEAETLVGLNKATYVGSPPKRRRPAQGQVETTTVAPPKREIKPTKKAPRKTTRKPAKSAKRKTR